MLSCKYAVAVFTETVLILPDIEDGHKIMEENPSNQERESKEGKHFGNPNVSFEFGFMCAFGVQNLLILTDDPKTLSIDTAVLRYEEFDKDNAKISIRDKVSGWLKEIRRLKE